LAKVARGSVVTVRCISTTAGVEMQRVVTTRCHGQDLPMG
jgi:hypothetical protein